MRKSILFVLVILIFLSCIGASCEEHNTTDNEQTQKQTESLKVMRDKIGDPEIKNFEEAQNLKDIYEDRDDPKLVCYWYTVNEMTGKLIYQGRCKGYGVPYSTQFSNPEKVADYEKESGTSIAGEISLGTIPQAEPNGLFMPTSSSATWVLTIKDDNTISVEYVEPTIIVSKTKKPKRLCDESTLPDDY